MTRLLLEDECVDNGNNQKKMNQHLDSFYCRSDQIFIYIYIYKTHSSSLCNVRVRARTAGAYRSCFLLVASLGGTHQSLATSDYHSVLSFRLNPGSRLVTKNE